MRYFVRFLKAIDEVLIVVGLLIVAAIIYFAWLANTADNVGELVHESAQNDLTAASAVAKRDNSRLAPIASYTGYRRCGSGVFSARLTGEPLACSASNLTDTLLSDPGAPGQTFYRQFGAACNRHDLCYIHGDVTYGFSRADCDRAFLADILKTCKLIYNNRPATKMFGVPLPFNLRKYCEFRAAAGYSAVKFLGWQYFYDNYSPVCDYESGPHGVRDHIVSGKFLDGSAKDYLVSLRLMHDFDTLKVTLMQVNDDGHSEIIETDKPFVVASDVPVLDRARACHQTSLHSGKEKLCPENLTLGATLVTAKDWLRFNPVIVDHDGDGKDEILLVSVSPDFGLGLTHLRFTEEAGSVKLTAEAYLGADRRKARPAASVCEWGLEFNNCLGPLRLNEAFRLNAPKRYKRAVAKLAIAKEELAEAEETGDDALVKAAKRDIRNAERLIQKTKGYRHASASSDIRSWRKEMQGFEKSKLRQENYFILSHDGTNQKTIHQFIPLRVKGGDDRWRYDLVMMSAHAFDDEAGDEDSGHVFRRFRFDEDQNGWVMTRDVFTQDGHLVAKCSYDDDNERRRYDQYRRYQYRAFPMRLHGFGDDRLATFQREKCPTSSINPTAGSLGDVDVMVYALEKDYSETSDFFDRENRRKSRLLQLAYTSWFPLIWSEAAHPLVTSKKAREKKIHIVGTYVGGAAKITYPVVSVLRDSQDLHVRMLQARERRLPDTYGKLAERYYLDWDNKKLGYPESYFELPSVLSTFDARGNDGLSLVYFNNPATSDWENNVSAGGEKIGETAKPPLGSIWALIFPIPDAFARRFSGAKLIECPVDAVAGHNVRTFSSQFRGSKTQMAVRSKESHHRPAEWKKHFLRHEPVLAGDFAPGKRGALVTAWRDKNGDISATALYHDGTEWRFGSESCKEVSRIRVKRLY